MTEKHTPMVLRRVVITRENDYVSYRPVDPSAPFRATIEVQGAAGKVELNLSAEMSQKIVAIIAEEVAAAGRATAEIMTADAMFIADEAQKALVQ